MLKCQCGLFERLKEPGHSTEGAKTDGGGFLRFLMIAACDQVCKHAACARDDFVEPVVSKVLMRIEQY